MNYYDYRSYFNSIERSLDSIYSRQGETLTELQAVHTDLNEKLDKLDTTITGGVTLIAALIVVSAAMRVIFAK
nr:MAG TPA: hypothetical protein [Inoviridae sp.]